MKIGVGQWRGLYSFLATIIFILCIFAPEFKHIPHIYTWVLALLGIMTLVNKSFVRSIGFSNIKNLNYWLYLIICFVIVLLPPLINQTSDFSYIKIIIGIALSSFRGVLLLYICYRINCNKILDEYCKYFFAACNVYVIFTLMFIVFPSFKEYWLNDILAETYISDYYYYQFRYSLNGFAGFSAASIFAFSCLLCGILLAKDTKLNRFHIIQFMICAVGCFLYGRIAIVGIVLGIGMIIIGKNSFSKVIKIIVRILIIACMLLVLLNVLSKSNEQFFYWRRWAFSLIRQFFVEHEITDYSYNRLAHEMYFMPNVLTLFFGDGYYTDPVTGRYYMSTDAGYMRLILYTGLIGMLLLFGILLYTFRRTYKAQKNAVNKMFVFSIFLLWLILEWKGESYQRILLLYYPFFLMVIKTKNFDVLMSN